MIDPSKADAMNDRPSILERMVQGLLAPRHALPQFLILGAQRSGTTTLYKWMTQHPQIRPATKKEIHFFDLNFRNGIPWYRIHFPLRSKLGDDRITGEASPYYLFHPRAPERIRSVLPDVKMIVLLRNPAERAVSHYFHEVRLGREDLPIEEALRLEESRLQPELEKMQKDEFYFSAAHQRHSYKARGLYAEQLKRYFDLFDRRQLLVLSSEEYFADPANALHVIFSFLEINAGFLPRNLVPQEIKGHVPTVPESVYQALQKYFEPHNEALFQLLGRNLGWNARQ
jgi:hypothetical protein